MKTFEATSRSATYTTDGKVVTISENGIKGDIVEVPADEILTAAELVQLKNGYLAGDLEKARNILEALRTGHRDGRSMSGMVEEALELLPGESDGDA